MKAHAEQLEEFQPLKSTLSIDTSDSIVPEEQSWDEVSKQPMIEESFTESESEPAAEAIIGAVPMAGVVEVFDVGLKAVELVGKLSKIVAEPESIHVLPKKDPDGLNYMGESFRSPAKGVYKKLFWTDSLYPCGFFSFYFNITSKGRPKNTAEVEDGFYIPNISIVPVNAWAWPLCELRANLVRSNPVRSETSDGLAVANIDMIVDMHLIKLGIFDWKSKISFKMSGDKTELIKTGETLPTPF